MSKYYNTWLKKHSNPNGTVYKITNVCTGEYYIGSTTNPIKKRLYQMISAANAGRKGLLYDNIRAWGKECFTIETLYECTVDDNVLEKEHNFIELDNDCLNEQRGNKYNV